MEKRLVQIKTRILKYGFGVIKAPSTNIFLLYWSKGFVFCSVLHRTLAMLAYA